MTAPYRIIDLDTFSGLPTGNEIIEISNGGTHSYQLAIALLTNRTQIVINSAQTYNLSAVNYGTILVSTTGAVVINLPDSTIRSGVPVLIADTSGTPNITINANGVQKIINQSSLTIATPYSSYNLGPITASPGGWFQI